MTLSKKTVLTYLLIAMIPMIIVGLVIWSLSSNSFNELGEYAKNGLKEAAVEKVNSIRKMKEEQIISFFDARKSDLKVLAQEIGSLMELPVMKNNGDPLTKRQLRIEMSFYSGMFENFCREYGYTNLYLFAPSGYCFYAVNKNDIVKDKLLEGEYKDTSLAQALVKTQETQNLVFSDYAPFVLDNNVPYSFMVMPIKVKDNTIMYIALQLGSSLVNSMMAKGGDIKQGTESYLVGVDGYMRSDTLLDPEKFGVLPSYNNDQKIANISSVLAQGDSGGGVAENYSGVKVITSYALIDIFGNKWVVISDENYAKAMSALVKMDNYIGTISSDVRNSSVLIVIVISVSVMVLAFFLSTALVKPIKFTSSMLNVLAERVESLSEVMSKHLAVGDWDIKVSDFRIEDKALALLEQTCKRSDELGAMGDSQRRIIGAIHDNINAVNSIIDNITIALLQVRSTSDQVAIGAGQLTESSSVLSDGATEQAKSMSQVSESIENITQQNNQSVKQTEQGLMIAQKTADKTRIGNEKVNELTAAIKSIEDRSKEIRVVTKLIEDIAFQTNLLALNAAVEAARAGVHGKGFAVVAEEVRTLAKRSADAVQKTVGMINNSERAVKSGVEIADEVVSTFAGISTDIEEISVIIENIVNKANLENDSLSKSANALTSINNVTQTNTAGAEETAAAAAEMQVTVDMLNEILAEFKLNEDILCESNINILTAGNQAKSKIRNNLGAEYGGEAEEDFEDSEYDAMLAITHSGQNDVSGETA